MKKISVILLGMVIISSAISCKHESFDERCAREAREYTQKQCPQQVGDGLTMDSMTYRTQGKGDNITDRKFTYYYTFSGKQDSLLNVMLTEYPDTARKRLGTFKENMLDALTNSVQLKTYKDKGFSFEYIYYSSKTKKTVLQFKFTKADYKH